MTAIDRLHKALRTLAAVDRERAVFGSDGHRYELTRVSEEELSTTEAALGICLPTEYRDFMLSVGHGAGPHYGCWSPRYCLEEFRSGLANLAEDGVPPVDAGRDFLPTTRYDALCGVKAIYPCDGAIPIGHQGCGWYTLLVTGGRQSGTVWEINVDDMDGYYAPAPRPPGVLPTGVRANSFKAAALPPLEDPASFFQWYQGWVVQALADLGAKMVSWFTWGLRRRVEQALTDLGAKAG